MYTKGKNYLIQPIFTAAAEPGPVLGDAGDLGEPGPAPGVPDLVRGDTVDTDPSALWAGLARRRQ